MAALTGRRIRESRSPSPASTTRQHNAIDYVRPNPAQKWQAVNLNGLRFSGVESTFTWKPGGIANCARRVDCSARRTKRLERPAIGVRLQLSRPEHPRRLVHRIPARLRTYKRGATGAALQADRVPGMEPRPYARLRARSAPTFASPIFPTPAIRRSPASTCPRAPSPAASHSSLAADENSGRAACADLLI